MAVARVLRNVDVAACWDMWLENVEELKVLRGRMQFALNAVRKQIERRGFNGWIEFANSRRHNQQLLKRAAGALKNGALHVGFNTWLDAIYGSIAPAGAEDEDDWSDSEEEAPAPDVSDSGSFTYPVT